MHDLSLVELASGLKEKKFSSVELTEHYLDRIKKYDPSLNSIVTVTEQSAREQAKQADKMRTQGDVHALCGIPMAHKDIFCTKGHRTSSGSKMLDNFIAPYSSTMVSQLDNNGLVMLGKCNMDEFAMGSSNETSFYGPVKNPWGHNLVPGGSSGGSAAAVAARLVPASTGTDTGGSIRQPAALCGITGLKPTYGRVSRLGMIAFASSLDQAGPMTKTAEDAALMLEVMAGFDPKDSTSLNEPVPQYSKQLNESLKGKTFGLPKEFFDEGLNPGTKAKVQDAIEVLQSLGATPKEISLPNLPYSLGVYYIVASAECSSNLSRFDGVKYGYRCDDPKDLLDMYTRTRAEGFGAEVKRRVMVGTYALSAGYYDAYYLKAQQVRRLISNDFSAAFKEVDFIVGPTTPSPAFGIGEKIADPLSMYLSDIYTIAANLAGLPALSLPAGLVDDLPVGLQMIGPHLQESVILNAGHQFQQATDWHTLAPKGFE